MTDVYNYYEDVLGLNPSARPKLFSDVTTTQEREARFETDQLTDRLLVKEIYGIRSVEVQFDDPIIVTQRLDEGLLTLKNLSMPKQA